MIAITPKQKHEKQFIKMAHKIEKSSEGLSGRAKSGNFSNIFSAEDFGGGLNRMVSCTAVLTNLSLTLRGRKDSYIKFKNPPQAEMFKAMNAIVSQIELHSVNGHVDTVARSAAALLHFVMKNFFYNPGGNDKGMTFEEVHQFLNSLQSFAQEEELLETLDGYLAQEKGFVQDQERLKLEYDANLDTSAQYGSSPDLQEKFQQIKTAQTEVQMKLKNVRSTIKVAKEALADLRDFNGQNQMLNDCMGALSVSAVMDMEGYRNSVANYKQAVIKKAVNKEILKKGREEIEALNKQFIDDPHSNQATQEESSYMEDYAKAVAARQSHAENAAKYHADGHPDTNSQINPNANPQYPNNG